MYKISLPKIGRTIEAEPGETILEASERQGTDVPHSCKAGRCGACKTMLLNGELELKRPYSRFILTDDERHRGLTLACRAVPRSDIIAVWADTAGPDGPQITSFSRFVVSIERGTYDIARLRIAPPANARFSFLPWQYASLKLGSCHG